MQQQQQPQAPMDPVQALAMGHPIIPPPSQSAPASNNGFFSPTGYVSSAIRNAANAATFNLADPIVAATGAAIPIPGWTEPKNPGAESDSYGKRFATLLKMSRGDTAQGQQAHPVVSLGSSVAGGFLNPVTRALPVAKTLGGAILQGAGIGGAYGAGGSIGTAKDIPDAVTQTAEGAALGGTMGAATHGLAGLLKGATMGPDQQLLSDEGVPLTIGQSLGGTAKSLEDGSTHIPIVGGSIEARQGDSLEGFNRAGYNRVLEPLGLTYDPAGPVGHDGISVLKAPIDEAYDTAWKGATISKTPEVLNGIDSATSQASHVLEPSKVAQIQANINRLVTGKFDENGELNANDLKVAKNFFAEQSRAAGPTASQADQATAKAYGNVLDALKEGIRQVDPSRGDLLDAADTAYMRFVRVRDATSPNAASARGGIFTPSQLGAAIRGNDNSIGRIDFATGTAPMQDLAVAGQKVLPSTVPNSGTPLRGLIQAAPWIGAAAMKSPPVAAGIAGGLGGGAALYSNPGQSLARALLYGAPATRAAISKVPQALLPGALAAALGSRTPAKPGTGQQGNSQ
jgi:hypothetical protein